MTTRTEVDPYGVLGTLSPQLAKDLGQAFSLESIGKSPDKHGKHDSAGSGAFRWATRVAAFLLVTVVAVSLTAGVVFLIGLT